MVNQFVKFLTRLASAFLLVSVCLVLVFRVVPVRLTPLMLIRMVEARRQGNSLAIRQTWVPIENISPDMIAAVVDSEDAHFYTHRGFDWDAICNAYHANRYYGRIVRGGSTISQQTAKNVFCTPSRTYLRKAFEAYFTALIELLWGKERIMEVYVNSIEMGDGIYGVKAVAELNFDKTPDRLTKRDAALIAATLPSPLTRDSKNPSGELLRRRNRIVQEMNYIKHVPFGCEEK